MVGFFQRHGDTLTILAALVVAFAALATLTNQRFNAQERYIEQRFNAQERYVEQRFNAQERYVEQRFNAVEQRFNAVEQRFDAVEQRFNAVEQRLDAQDRRLDVLTNEVSELRKLLTGIVERVSRNEGEIDVIRQQMQTTDTPAP